MDVRREPETPRGKVYEDLRPLLFSIAYRIVSSVSEAEDIVQEAFLRFHREQQQGADIDSPRAWLSTVTTRLAINKVRSARARRETYVGTWLPETLLTEPATLLRATARPCALSSIRRSFVTWVRGPVAACRLNAELEVRSLLSRHLQDPHRGVAAMKGCHMGESRLVWRPGTKDRGGRYEDLRRGSDSGRWAGGSSRYVKIDEGNRPSDREAKGLRIAPSRHRVGWPTRQEDRSWLCRRESARSKVTQQRSTMQSRSSTRRSFPRLRACKGSQRSTSWPTGPLESWWRRHFTPTRPRSKEASRPSAQ